MSDVELDTDREHLERIALGLLGVFAVVIGTVGAAHRLGFIDPSWTVQPPSWTVVAFVTGMGLLRIGLVYRLIRRDLDHVREQLEELGVDDVHDDGVL
jgi:hypothetical protein